MDRGPWAVARHWHETTQLQVKCARAPSSLFWIPLHLTFPTKFTGLDNRFDNRSTVVPTHCSLQPSASSLVHHILRPRTACLCSCDPTVSTRDNDLFFGPTSPDSRLLGPTTLGLFEARLPYSTPPTAKSVVSTSQNSVTAAICPKPRSQG